MNGLVTAPIWRPILPPLIQALNPTVKLLLSQPLVDLVMPLAQPPTEREPTAHVWRVDLHVRAKMRRAVRTRVQYWQ